MLSLCAWGESRNAAVSSLMRLSAMAMCGSVWGGRRVRESSRFQDRRRGPPAAAQVSLASSHALARISRHNPAKRSRLPASAAPSPLGLLKRLVQGRHGAWLRCTSISWPPSLGSCRERWAGSSGPLTSRRLGLQLPMSEKERSRVGCTILFAHVSAHPPPSPLVVCCSTACSNGRDLPLE